MNIKVSIIVPCYKQSEYLDECLQSVMEQTYKNWECIIVNDGSPDETEAIAKIWIEKDARFKYVFTENKGVSHARNLGIQNAEGTIILPLDADDAIAKEYLEQAVAVFEIHPEVKVVYCKAEKFGDETGEWNLPAFSLQNLAHDNMVFCAAFFKKQDWETIGGFDEKMLTGLEDWEFWIHLLKKDGEVVRLEQVGFYYRIKKSSRQKDIDVNNRKQLYDYLSIKHADFFVKYLGNFMTFGNKINQLEKNHFKNVVNKKKALKILLKSFFGIDYFK